MKLDGFRELEKTMIQMAKEFGYRNTRNALNPALKEALGPVKDQQLSNTPVDRGTLKESISIRSGLAPVKKSNSDLGGSGNDNIVAAATVGWRGGSSHQQINVEYGNRTREPTRVIRNSLEDNQTKVLDSLRSGWRKALVKASNRLEKRRGLGKLKIR